MMENDSSPSGAALPFSPEPGCSSLDVATCSAGLPLFGNSKTSRVIFFSRCLTAGQGCHVCKQPVPQLLPIGNSLPQQAKEMFHRNEESLKKIENRLSFQQLHLNTYLDILSRKIMALGNKLKSKSNHVEAKRQELSDMEQAIDRKSKKVKQLEEAVERMKSKEMFGQHQHQQSVKYIESQTVMAFGSRQDSNAAHRGGTGGPMATFKLF